MHNIHWLRLTSQYKQMLHLKASEGTGNNEIWVLLKCQKPIQTTLWTVPLMCRVRKGTAQCNHQSALSSVSWKWITQLLISIRRTRLLYLPSWDWNGPPFIAYTHTHTHRPEHKESNTVQCTGMQTHTCTHTNTNRHLSESGRLQPLQCVCFCADGQFRWADFQSRL